MKPISPNACYSYLHGLFFLICLLSAVGASAQTTIWSEDFSTYADGTENGSGTGTSTATWSTNNGNIDVRTSGGNKVLRGSNTGSTTAYWTTNTINISTYTNVGFSLDANYGPGLDSGIDVFRIQYRINGGAYVEIENTSGDTNPPEPIQPSYSVTGLSGNTLEFRITMYNTASAEFYEIDDVLVTGTNSNDTDGDGIENSVDNCPNLFNPVQADSDGDGVGNFCDLDDDNDGILDTDECTSPVAPAALGPNLVLNSDFEEGYRYWTSGFNRGSNNYNGGGGVPDTSGGCATQGWVAVSPFSSTNGLCNDHYDYFGGEPDGSKLIIDENQTGDNVYNDTTPSSANSCLPTNLPDHTTGTGNSVYIDPNDLTGVNYWEQTVYGIEANTNYYFSAFIMVIENTPSLSFNIDGAQVLGPVTLTRQTGGSNGPDVWQEVAFIWNSGATTGALDLSISNETGGCFGNDLRLDDITFAANLTDSDSDDIADCLDNDIDNDGCPDALEGDGGILLSQINELGQITGGVDANGVPLLASGGQSDVSSTDPTIFGSECVDSDNDGYIDLVDLDDDNDGILDSVECGAIIGGTVDTATNSIHFNNPTNAEGEPGTTYADNGTTYPGGNSVLLLQFPEAVPLGTEITVFLGADPSVTDSDMQVQRSDASGNDLGFLADANNTFPGSIRAVTFTVSGSTIEYIRIIAYNHGARVYGAKYGGNTECADTDGDGITNDLDLDSDGDGCFDAIEGDGGFTFSNINGAGVLTGGVDTDGVPNSASGGQAQGSSVNLSVSSGICDDDNDGVDNDNDTCPYSDDAVDTDGDGVPDGCDNDDDNDGITDCVESSDTVDNEFGWELNNPPGGLEMDLIRDPKITDWVLDSTGTMTFSGGPYDTSNSSIRINSINATSFEEAMTDAHYIEVSFTTGSEVSAFILSAIRSGWYEPNKGDSYYSATVYTEASSNAWTTLSSDVFHTDSGAGVYITFQHLNTAPVSLQSNTEYKFRFYVYGQIDDSPETYSVFDDVIFEFTACREQDTDTDTIADHLDADSDGDGCGDADEAYNDANTDTDNNGSYGSGLPTVDADGNVVAASYAEPVDSDSNGIYDHMEAGTSITIDTQPDDEDLKVGEDANFSVAVTGNDLSYQWYVSTDGGSGYTLMPGETANALAINNVTLSQNGNLYRVEVGTLNNVCGTVVSDSALLAIQVDDPTVVDADGNQNYCPGFSLPVAESISITDPDDTSAAVVYIEITSGYVNGEDVLTLTGTHPSITATWDAPNGEITLTGPATFSEFETAVLAIEYASSAVAPTGNRQFTITVGDPPDDVSDVTVINMIAPATITTAATDQIVGIGDNATFSVTATGTALTYQWQESTDGGTTFIDLPGATTASYSLIAGSTDNGNIYRVTVSDGPNACASTSSAATLRVYPDTDGDGVLDSIDVDDDNDGILDCIEAADSVNSYFAWMLNNPAGNITMDEVGDADINNWVLSGTSNYSASGITADVVTSVYHISDMNSTDFSEAFANDDYLEVSFTTASGLIDPKLTDIVWNWFIPSEGDSYATALLISDNDFITYKTASIDVFATDDGSTTATFDLLQDADFTLQSSTTYTVRVYFYGQIDDTPEEYSVFDDFQFTISACQSKDTDGDGNFDHLEIDSDNDGCNDVREAGFTESSSKVGELEGTGYDNLNGQVTGNADGYTAPADNNGNTVYDFQETGTPPSITTQPTDTSTCPGCDASFVIGTSNVETYQWQLFNGTDWIDLTDTGIYSGTASATLTLTNVQTTENGNQYRVITANSVYACNEEISNTVTLAVKVATVITNRRITYRVKKD